MKKFNSLAVAISLGSAAMFAASPASYPGGQEAMTAFIASNIRYPQSAIDNMIEGVVTVQFTVNVDGSISDTKVVHALDPDLEAEALRVVKSFPAWTPATDDSGTPVARQVEVPVKFRLTD